MVKRLLKLLLSFAYLLPLLLAGALVPRAGRRRPGCRILYYHRVSKGERPAFARQMDLLVRLSHPIPLDRPGEGTGTGRCSAVAFDDAFQDVVENAVPELVQRRIPATIFVPSGLLGKTAAWLDGSDGSDPVMSAEVMQSLPPDLITIGSHTVTHARLAGLDPIEALSELVESKRQLEDLLQRPVTLLAFPYGSYDDQAVRLSREAGYQRVFTVEPFAAFRTPEEFVSGRVPVSPRDWEVEFRLKVLGAYEWVPMVGRWKRKLGFGGSPPRSARRDASV